MKAFYFFLIGSLLWASCASSQNKVSADITDKATGWRTLLKLSADQTKRVESIETRYWKQVKQLNSEEKPSKQSLQRLDEKRTKAFQNILSREQFIKWQAIDKKLLYDAPVRSKE